MMFLKHRYSNEELCKPYLTLSQLPTILSIDQTLSMQINNYPADRFPTEYTYAHHL